MAANSGKKLPMWAYIAAAGIGVLIVFFLYRGGKSKAPAAAAADVTPAFSPTGNDQQPNYNYYVPQGNAGDSTTTTTTGDVLGFLPDGWECDTICPGGGGKGATARACAFCKSGFCVPGAKGKKAYCGPKPADGGGSGGGGQLPKTVTASKAYSPASAHGAVAAAHG